VWLLNIGLNIGVKVDTKIELWPGEEVPLDESVIPIESE